MALSPFYSSESPPAREGLHQGRGRRILQSVTQPCPKTTSKVQVGTSHIPRPGCEWARTSLRGGDPLGGKIPQEEPQPLRSSEAWRGAGLGRGGPPLTTQLPGEHLLAARPRPGEVPRGPEGPSHSEGIKGSSLSCSLVLPGIDREKSTLPAGSRRVSLGCLSGWPLKNKEEFAECKGFVSQAILGRAIGL